MDHSQAKQTMASERYLLGELAPEERDAFEDHLFDCPDCALDVRAADAFMQGAKAQLAASPAPAPATAALATPVRAASARSAPDASKPKRRRFPFFFSWNPAFAAPVFASLLGVIAYQNLATIPRLRSETTQPRIVPWASLHLGARGAAAMPVQTDPIQGAVLLVQLPQTWTYALYQFDFYDSNARRLWSRTVAAPASSGASTLSLVIPSTGLQPASYTLAVSSISPSGERTEIDRRALTIYFQK